MTPSINIHPVSTAPMFSYNTEDSSSELMESVYYARRIQEAILPNPVLFTAVFEDSFVMFRPKDIISGDFYCYTRLGNKTVVAVADCTGHGVPGAMVSIMGYTILDDIIKCNGLSDPSQVLARLDKAVRKLFKQGREGHGVDDGMDIAVCTIDHEAKTLAFAGANRPLYHFSGSELNIVQGNKNGIGGQSHPTLGHFDPVTVPFQTGDSIYLFSDGYTDQFGGADNKKFMRKRFIELLQSIQHLDMTEQEMEIEREHQLWKGENAQTDDITVMGLKL